MRAQRNGPVPVLEQGQRRRILLPAPVVDAAGPALAPAGVVVGPEPPALAAQQAAADAAAAAAGNEVGAALAAALAAQQAADAAALAAAAPAVVVAPAPEPPALAAPALALAPAAPVVDAAARAPAGVVVGPAAAAAAAAAVVAAAPPLTPAQIAALTPDQIALLTPAQIAALTPDQISALTPLQILYFSHDQAMKIKDENIVKDTPAFYAEKITEFLEKKNIDDIPTFKEIPGIRKDFESMSKFTELLSKEVGQMLTEYLKIELGLLEPDKRRCIILLTAFLMLHYKNGFLPSSISKTPLHLGKLIKTLTEADVEALTSEHIDVLMPQQINEFELKQVMKLEQSAAKSLFEKIKKEKIKLDKTIQLVINIRALLPVDIPKLSQDVFEGLVEGIEYFSEDQIGKLTTDKINQLEKSDLEKLTIEQLKKLALIKNTKNSVLINQLIRELNETRAGFGLLYMGHPGLDRLAQSRSELDGTELNAIMGYVAILALLSDNNAECESVFNNGKKIQEIVRSRISIKIDSIDKIITKDDLYKMLKELSKSANYPDPIDQKHLLILNAIRDKIVGDVFTQPVKDALNDTGNITANANIGLPIILQIRALMDLMSPTGPPAENIGHKLADYLIKSGKAQELLSPSPKNPSPTIPSTINPSTINPSASNPPKTKFDPTELNIVPKDTNSDNTLRAKADARTKALAEVSDKYMIDGLISNGVYNPLFIDYLDKLKPDTATTSVKKVDNILPIIAQSSLRKILFKVYHPIDIGTIKDKDKIKNEVKARRQAEIEALKLGTALVNIPKENTVIDTLIASGMAEIQILNITPPPKAPTPQQLIVDLLTSRKTIKELLKPVSTASINRQKIDYVKALKTAELLGVPLEVIIEIENLREAIDTDPYKSHIELKSKFLNECLVFYLNNKGLMLANILGIKIEHYELFYKLFIDNLGKKQDDETIGAFITVIFREFSYLSLIDIYKIWQELSDIPLNTESLRQNPIVDDEFIIKNHLFRLFQYLTHSFAAIRDIKLSCESLFAETNLDLSLKEKSVPYQSIVEKYLAFMKSKYHKIKQLDGTDVSIIGAFETYKIDWNELINNKPALDITSVTETAIQENFPSGNVTYFREIDRVKITEIITNAKLLFQNITNLETQLINNDLTILDVHSNLLLNKKILFYLLKLLALLQNKSGSKATTVISNLIDSANPANAELFDQFYNHLLIMNILSNLAKIDGLDDSSKNKQMSIGKLLEDYTIAIPERVINAVMTLSDLRQFDNTRLNREMLSGDKYPVSKLFLKAELSNITQGYPYYFQIADKLFTFAGRMKRATDYFNPTIEDGHKKLETLGFTLDKFRAPGSTK